MTAHVNWDKLERLEFAAWMEENPGGKLKAFQAHLDRINGKIAPQAVTVEVLTRGELRRLRQLVAR